MTDAYQLLFSFFIICLKEINGFILLMYMVLYLTLRFINLLKRMIERKVEFYLCALEDFTNYWHLQWSFLTSLRKTKSWCPSLLFDRICEEVASKLDLRQCRLFLPDERRSEDRLDGWSQSRRISKEVHNSFCYNCDGVIVWFKHV